MFILDRMSATPSISFVSDPFFLSAGALLNLFELEVHQKENVMAADGEIIMLLHCFSQKVYI